MTIKNIEQLQNHLLNCIERTDKKKMDIEELSIVAKAAEAIFSSIKLQISYNHLRNETPNIEFLQKCNNGKPGLSDNKPKKLEMIK